MLLIFIIWFDNVDCDIYNVLYCLYIECKIDLSINLYIYLHMVADCAMSYYRVFAWRPFAPPHESTTLFMHRVFAPVCRIFAWRGERSPRENPPKSPFGVFSRGDLSPRQAKIRQTGENAKGRHSKTRQMMTFSCFRMATFRPATRKYATFHALRFRLLFVVSLPGEAKGRHAETRQNHLLAGFRVATFRVFAPKTRLYGMA